MELTKEFLHLETTTQEFETVQERPIPSRKYVKGDQSIVAMVRATTRREGIEECFRLLGGIEKAFETPQSDMALLKPNLNSPDPYPWSTRLETIALTFLEFRIIFGDSNAFETSSTVQFEMILGSKS